MLDLNDVALRLRKMALERRLTAGRLAAMANLSERATALFLSGYVPSMRTIDKLANALGYETRVILLRQAYKARQTDAPKTQNARR